MLNGFLDLFIITCDKYWNS